MIRDAENSFGQGNPGPTRVPSTPAFHVLHVDDDSNDMALLEAATRKANVQFVLHSVEDGEQALCYLSGLGVFADRANYPLPSLILLDLKMPRATGFEVLNWVRNQPGLSKLPVVILSGSELQEDIRQAYTSGATSYLVKPLGFHALVNLVKSLDRLWLAKKGQDGATLDLSKLQLLTAFDAGQPSVRVG